METRGYTKVTDHTLKTMETTYFPTSLQKSWNWKGHKVAYIHAPKTDTVGAENDGCSPSVVLIHGFGACKEHWRYNVGYLRTIVDVYAIDLIGFGDSDKPRSRLSNETDEEGGYQYGIDGWASQVTAFISEVIRSDVTLVGNSIGGVVALAVADQLEKMNKPARDVVLIDCAQRALDDQRLSEQPPFRRIARPLLKLAVKQRWLTSAIFSAIAKPGIIRRVLLQAYPTGKNVDDELVNILLKPTTEPGSRESFRGFINLFQDRIAPEFLGRITTPVTMLWGKEDPWEPIDEARKWKKYECVKRLVELTGLGHCPHDEAPEVVNDCLREVLLATDGLKAAKG